MATRNSSVHRDTPGADKLGLEAGAPTFRVERSSGNVFADLGLADANEVDTRVRLGFAVNRALEARRLTQKATAKLLAMNQPKVSALKHYELEGFIEASGERVN